MEKLAKVEHSIVTNEDCDRFKIAVAIKEEDTDLDVASVSVKEKITKFTESINFLSFEHELQINEPTVERLTQQSTNVRKGEREQTDVFIGFRVTQEVVIDMAWVAEHLCKVVMVCEKHDLLQDAQIASYLSDTERRKKALLTRVVREAQDRVRTICEAAGDKLGHLVAINDKPEVVPENLRFGRVNSVMGQNHIDSLMSMADEGYEEDTRTVDRTISVMSREILKKRSIHIMKEEVYLTFAIE